MFPQLPLLTFPSARLSAGIIYQLLLFLCSVVAKEVGDLGVAFLKLLFACHYIIMAEP